MYLSFITFQKVIFQLFYYSIPQLKILLQIEDLFLANNLKILYNSSQLISQINLLHNRNKIIIHQDRIMKKYQKHIRFQNIQLRVDKEHPKDISRVLFNIIEQNHQVHKTKKYGNVNPMQIIWPTPIQFKYLAQSSFRFETICEHEYGYQIQQLKALYYGQIKIKPEDFFHINRFNVYNSKGQKCGKVSFMIKVIDREMGLKYNQDQQVQNRQRIKTDLVGRLNFIQANLQIYPNYLVWFQNKRKQINKNTKANLKTQNLNLKDLKKDHSNTKNSLNLKNLELQLKFDSNYITGKMKQKYNWKFKEPNCKAQLYQKSENNIRARVKQGQIIILEGKLQIATLLKNKRFLTQNISLSNQSREIVGVLKLEMRIIQKKELLDLMYSPKKLQQLNMQKTDFQLQQSRLSHSFQNKNIQIQTNNSVSQSTLFKLTKRMSLDIKRKDSFSPYQSRLQSPEGSQNKNKKIEYQRYLRKRYQQIQFGKSKRFPQIQSINPYICYEGQNQRSDFSPKRKVKAVDFSLTQRTDFTKPYKHHPGIGDYHLPSIWQKN